MKHIASRDNPYYKALKKLSQDYRERRKTGRIFLEGLHLVESYIQHYVSPIDVIVSESGRLNRENADFLESCGTGKKLCVLSDALFDEVSALETPGGILALADQPVATRALDQAGDVILLDGIQDPGNLGSIFRSAAAAGFIQILLSTDCAQAWSPKTLRAGMGAHFQLEIYENSDLHAFLETYRGQAILTTPLSETTLYAVALKSPVAWVFGNEGQGIRPEIRACVRQHVRIPMPGKLESLNVAAAAAVCLFETLRQRQTI